MADWSDIQLPSNESKPTAPVDWSGIEVPKSEPVKAKPKPTPSPDMWAETEASMVQSVEDVNTPMPFQDLAKIAAISHDTGEVDEKYLENVDVYLKQPVRTLYATLLERPAWGITEGAFRTVQAANNIRNAIIPKAVKDIEDKFGVNKQVKGWLSHMVDYYAHPEKNAPAYSEMVKARSTYMAATESTIGKLGLQLGFAGNDVAGLIAQLVVMRTIAPPAATSTYLGKVAQRVGQVGAHSLLTSNGDLGDRFQAAAYRVAYNITPYIANATGATGVTATAVDIGLNTFLTSPSYIRAYKEAGGINKEFVTMALPQFVMDFAMALSTRGTQTNLMRAQIDKYADARAKSLGMSKPELYKMVEDIQIKTEMEKVATGEKPTDEVMERAYQKTLSKYPQKITDSYSLQQVGEKMGVEVLGLNPRAVKDFTWALKHYPHEQGMAGTHSWTDRPSEQAMRNEGKFGKTKIVVKKGFHQPVKGWERVGHKRVQGWEAKEKSVYGSASQAAIKKTLLHELVHAMPEVREKRVHGTMHPEIFYEKYHEAIPKLFDTIEKTMKEDPQARQMYDSIIKEVEPAPPSEKALTPTTPPPPPPPPSKGSPGYSSMKDPAPEPGPPVEWSAVKTSLNHIYKSLDIEARWNALGAKETGFHVKNYYSLQGAIQDKGAHMIGKMTKLGRMPVEMWARATYFAAQPARMKDLSKAEYDRMKPVIDAYNVWSKDMLAKHKEAGTLKDAWPASYIKQAEQDIGHNLFLIRKTETSDMPAGLKQHRIDKLNLEIVESKGAIKFLQDKGIEYVHIPTRLWMQKLWETNPVQAKSVMSQYFRERGTLDIQKLASFLKNKGLITDKDIDLRNIMAAYAQKSGQLIGISNILNSAMKEGLILDRDKAPSNWPEFQMKNAPTLQGKKVHPAFDAWVTRFSNHSQGAKLGHIMSYIKIAQFDNPLFLPAYDLYQAFWLGSARSIKTPLYAFRAIRSMLFKDESYQQFMENGAASKPYTAPFDDFMKAVEMKKKSDSFLNSSIEYLKQNGRWPLDLVYKPIWHIAWGGDQLIRMMSAHYLKDKGFTYRESAQIAAKYHSDYASVPPELRNVLNKIWFTPVFPITMGKLQGEMIHATGKMLTDAAKLKLPAKKDFAYFGGLAAMAGLAVLVDNLLVGQGYKRDTFGYRYTKKVITDTGDEKELVVSTPNPGNTLLRYAKTFDKWPTSPDEFVYALKRATWRLHPLWRTSIQLGMNRRDDGTTPIYNPHDDPSAIAHDIIQWTAGKLVAVFKHFEDTADTKEARDAASSAFREDIGTLWRLFLETTSTVYLRGTPESRRQGQTKAALTAFRYFSKHKPPKDEAARERADQRFMDSLYNILEGE